MTQTIDFGERARQARDERDNRELRAQLAAALAAEAAREASQLPPGMEARIWDRVERRVATARPVERGWRRVLRAGPWLAAAVAALVVLPLAFGDFQALLGRRFADDGMSGVKAAGAPAAARITTLRFAVVDERDLVRPGDGETRVRVGQAIVFSVEAEGVDAEHSVAVALDYVAPDGETGTIASDYRLRAAREILTGERGYLAFSPSRSGVYRFTAKDGKHESGVAVRVVE